MRKIFFLFALVVFFTFFFSLSYSQKDTGSTKLAGFQQHSLEQYIGEPVFFMHELFEGRGGRSIVTAHDGTVLAFRTFGGGHIRKSKDGGKTWSGMIEIGQDATGNALVNEMTGEILLINPRDGNLWKSNDNGQSWVCEEIEIIPDGFEHGTPDGVPVGVTADQSGITLMFGENMGRLVSTGRILGPENSNDVEWRPYHYNTAIYSDDGGKTWQVSKPFPVFGTGEAALAEISDGSIIYNSREHMSIGNRFIAWSYDGGDTWLNAYRCPYLPDGPRGNSYGLMGGLIRLPVKGHDILIYSNLDTDSGVMPDQVGGSVASAREKITVWVSFDGGKTWPVKRLVLDGPSAYSNLGAGRPGTPSEGMIYLLFEGGLGHQDFYKGDGGAHSAINVAVFNLGWILEGRDINEFISN